ncbi:Ferredoxin--NADP reductase [subsurface metagenome]
MRRNKKENTGRKYLYKIESYIRIKGEKKLELIHTQASPCSAECPLGTNVKAYVSLIAAGRFSDALEVVRRTNPFPGICGRVCPHPCEDQCIRGEIDEPVSIALLKRFLADYELRTGVVPRYKQLDKKDSKVAVIGSGPAGLTCAADLARLGYKIDVFEKLSIPGGMMAVGIPAYRLPKDILQVEIAAIEALGVEIKLNMPIDNGTKFDELVREFDAVFIAVGAQKPGKLDIPGEQDVQQGLVDWTILLRESHLRRGKPPGDTVVIVGGGNTAVDCARVALRLGTKNVRILYRRSIEEMPAYKEEVAGAEDEGIKIDFLTAPVRLLNERGKLAGVECMRMRLGEKDKSGRRKPVPIPNSQFVIRCDAIIPAVGQELDPSFLRGKHKLKVSSKHLLVVDPDTMTTNQKSVFAGGDAVTGSASVPEAIAAGHRAARSIDRYINGLPLKCPPVDVCHDLKELTTEVATPPKMLRIAGLRLQAGERKYSFDEIDRGLTELQAVAEAERCMRCGPCMECKECVGGCDSKQIIIEPAELSAKKLFEEQGTMVRVEQDIHRKIAAQGAVSSYKDEQYMASVFTVKIDEHLCRGCGVCEEICGYRAVQVVYRGDGVFYAEVNEDMCRGCGTCVAVCPSGALTQNYFTAYRINHLVDSTLQRSGGRFPVLIFACRWNSVVKYASSGLPAEIIYVMCTGRIAGGDILKAFESGAAGVLIIGCKNDDCHYGSCSRTADENLKSVSSILSLLGFGRERLRVVQIPAQGGPDSAGMVKDFFKEIENLGESPIGREK